MLPLIVGWGAPVIALALLAAAGAAWFRVPLVGKYVGAALLATAAGVVCYGQGFRDRAAIDRSAQLLETIREQDDLIAEQNRQARAAREIAAADARRAAEAEKLSSDLQGKVDDYATELAKRPANSACALSSDDLRRLQSIGGAAVAPPEPPVRPRAIRPAGRGSAAETR